MSRLFITGTDTDVGKTIVTAGLLRLLRERGVDAVSMKPVQTGAEMLNGEWTAPDLVLHWDVAGLHPDTDERKLMAPYLYEPACSPHLAGRMENRYPQIDYIVECARALEERHNVLLIEGAGGAMAPVDESNTMIDMMVALEAAVVLVAHRGLGTINHTLLSLAALRAAGLEVLGVVFNEVQDVEPDFIKQDNPKSVEQFGNVEVLGNIDYLGASFTQENGPWKQFEAGLTGLNRIVEYLK